MSEVGGFTSTVNNFTKNKYRLFMSNFPNLTNLGDELDTSVLTNYVKSVTMPDHNIQQLYSFFQHERQQHPNPLGARDLNTISIEWIVDDKMTNYFYFYSWLFGSRYGYKAREAEGRKEALLRDNCIDELAIYTMDNAENVKAKMVFYRAFLTGVGNLPLEFGIADTATFTTTFEFEKCGLILQKKDEKGKPILEQIA